MVYNCLIYIQDKLYPHICCLCGQSSQLHMDLCKDCLGDLLDHGQLCHRCGSPVSVMQTDAICGHCLKQPPPYRHTLSAFCYEAPLTRLITRLKFNGKIQLANMFARAWIHQHGNKDIEIPDAILPVPMHRRRIWTRGYNQALEIARPIARHFRLPVLIDHVVRTRPTKPQSDLNARERNLNIRGCFQVMKAIPYQRIAIVDDVVTTGSTVRELASALAVAGVEVVDVWCIARAVNRQS